MNIWTFIIIGVLGIAAALVIFNLLGLLNTPYRPYGEGMLPRYDDYPPLDTSRLQWRTYTSRRDGFTVRAAQVQVAGYAMTSDGMMCVWQPGDYVVMAQGHTYHVPGRQFVALYGGEQ